VAALERGQVIEAIRLLRQSGGLDLKAAKAQVDRFRQQAPARTGLPRPTTATRIADHLSPGEQPRGLNWTATGLVVVAVLTGIVWWLGVDV
jgi:hypothetical protein